MNSCELQAETSKRSMENGPNWVERRAMRERALHNKSGDVWNELRASLQNACDSYNQYYCPPQQPLVEHKEENVSRLIVVRTIPAAEGVQVLHLFKVTMAVTFKRDEFKIVATRENGSESTFVISADENRAFLTRTPGNAETTADEVAQLILEPLFFGSCASSRTVIPALGEYMR